MENWLKQLKHDPIQSLKKFENKIIHYFTDRDLLDKKVEPITVIWEKPEVTRVLNKQEGDGSWKYSGKKVNLYPPHHYPLVATFKIFRQIIEKYEMDKTHTSCKNAAEFILSCQTEDGDIRGMIGNQYATYYTGYILFLLVKAGYGDDKRIIKGFDWLLEMRQNDGGWTIPILTHHFDRITGYKLTSEFADPVEPDRSQPFSHNWTNMVLQGFSVHPVYKDFLEVKKAADLMKSRFFKRDVYTSYQSSYYWTRFGFWWPNILTALESLQRLGYDKDDKDIALGLQWFFSHQQEDGLWNIENNPKKTQKNNVRYLEKRLWLTLRICRMLRNFYI